MAALATGLAAPLAHAEDAKPAEPAKERKRPHDDGPEGKMKGHVAERLKALGEKLGLTPEQKEKIRPIVIEEIKAREAVRGDESLDRAARREKMREVTQPYRAQIRAVLTPEQQAKFDQVKEDAKEEMRENAKERREKRQLKEK